MTGGTVNGTGSLVMEAQAIGSDTVLARIVAMVTEAQRSRAPIQAVADRVNVNNLYDCYAWFDFIELNSGAVYCIDEIT